MSFRGDQDSPTEPDAEAEFWRLRTEDEERFHSDQLADAETKFAAHAQGNMGYSGGNLSGVQEDLDRLGSFADRLAALSSGIDTDVEFTRWLWRTTNKRRAIESALDTGRGEEIWQALRETAFAMRAAYRAGLAVSHATRPARSGR